MAARVREFLTAHRTETEGEEPALTRLEQLMERATTLAASQREGLVQAKAATAERAEIRGAIETKLLRFLRAAGIVASHANVGLAALFALPPNATHQAFLTTAKGMLDAATLQKDVLVKEGMKASVLDDLTAALQQFERTLETSRTARRAHIEARAELQAVYAEIGERVRVLDGLVRYRFGDDPELMEGWASARGLIGSFRSHSQPASTDGQTPGTQGPDAAQPAA